MDLSIVDLERFTVDIPFREVPARNLYRELPDFTFFEVFRVTLKCGAVGTGEVLRFYYPWGETKDQIVAESMGQNACELMWDDSIGHGFQMALFDAVGKALELPVHALLGKKVHDTAPMSWWAIDMPPEDWASECRMALDLGYLDFKTKGRPWFDIYAQMAAIHDVVPENFRFDLDFNATLLDSDHAIPIVKELQSLLPNFYICEGPITGVEESRKLREAVTVPIAHHAGSLATQLRDEVCDGYVLTGGASSILRQGTVCGEFDRPFWLQQVGSGLTAAFSMHLMSVLTHATWPSVSCHQLYKEDLLSTPIEVVEGFARIPDGPGLGVEIDEGALERLRLEQPYAGYNPERLIEVLWPNGARFYYSSGNQLWKDAQKGNMPVFIKDVTTRVVPDDGAARWRELHTQALESPVREGQAGA
jgi:L-alanine-DL-glutamate epimerase-like enolase superfamily enzyme